MSETDMRKVAAGAVLLVVSSALILGTGVGVISSALPVAVISIAALGMAAGAVLVGTSDPGRPV